MQGTRAHKARGHVGTQGTQGTMARRARRTRNLADSQIIVMNFVQQKQRLVAL